VSELKSVTAPALLSGRSQWKERVVKLWVFRSHQVCSEYRTNAAKLTCCSKLCQKRAAASGKARLVMYGCIDLESRPGSSGANNQLHPGASDRFHQAVYDPRNQHSVPQAREEGPRSVFVHVAAVVRGQWYFAFLNCNLILTDFIQFVAVFHVFFQSYLRFLVFTFCLVFLLHFNIILIPISFLV